MTEHVTFIVTGGAGFVGSNLVAELQRRQPSCHVIVLDNFRTGSIANIDQACKRRGCGGFCGTILKGSTSQPDWDDLLLTYCPTAVFHLGAITDTTLTDEEEMARENCGGFREMLAAVDSAKLRRHRSPTLVYASSAAVYGIPLQAIQRRAFVPSAAGHPTSPYGRSKWLMECIHRDFADRHPDTPVVGLRYFNVYGPGEASKGRMASMVYQLAQAMIAGRAPRVFADGTQARDQIHVDDAVDCTLAAACLAPSRPEPGVYNVGSGTAITFNAIIGLLREELPESRLPTEYTDVPNEVRAIFQPFTLADLTETGVALRWGPRRSPEAGIRSYARWLRCTHAESVAV